MPAQKIRRCSKCGKSEPDTAFYASEQSYCKPCWSVYESQRRRAKLANETREEREHRLAHRRLKRYGRAERIRHRRTPEEAKALGQERARQYYREHREERIAYVKSKVDPAKKREYDRAHNQKPTVRAVRAQQRRAWALANWDKYLAYCKDASLRRRNQRLDETARAFVQVLLSDPCCYCGGSMEHIDHIEPIRHGGNSSWKNLTAACARCNHDKRDLPLLAFLAR